MAKKIEAKELRSKKAEPAKSARRAATTAARARKASTKRPETPKQMAARAKPVAPFMCFDTGDDNIFIKCDWNPTERRSNKNCRKVTRSECVGGA